MADIVIVDYGMGNLMSVSNIVQKLGAKPVITSDPRKVASAGKLILPGVGACKIAMQQLEKLNLIDAIYKFIKSGKPYLGICLGLQLLFCHSEEGGGVECLKILKGNVLRFKDDVKIPHMGWNQVKIIKQTPLLTGIQDNSFVYFVHSYYVEPEDKHIVMSKTYYGRDFTSSINIDNIYGTQFHPEKSQSIGKVIIKNFLEAK